MQQKLFMHENKAHSTTSFLTRQTMALNEGKAVLSSDAASREHCLWPVPEETERYSLGFISHEIIPGNNLRSCNLRCLLMSKVNDEHKTVLPGHWRMHIKSQTT